MDIPPELKDWSLVRSFLAVADTGSLSAAARELGCSQPTLGRQVQALERALGMELFTRHARGFALSDAGAGLMPMARQMQDAMQAITLAAAGQSTQLEGTVRITASVFASHHLLPPVLAHIREAEPAIQLELLPSDTSENLLFREADIALRMYRPTQLDLVARHVTDLELGVFAARRYLDRRGRPATPEDLLRHDLIGYDRNDLILRGMAEMGWPVQREDFVIRCDNQATYWELLRAGCGIGFSQIGVARADPDVEQLDLGLDLPVLPVWLTTHQVMRQTPRVRRVWDLLAEGLSRG
ncbi:LysR family transcriptional regulator [Sedimentitalea sp. XS_ASV28]|uniref:LysR family transcriptional regulator n=1 Tax=Sedimentitalea sp. XS_ASV28 TaxID=3241296 RepID=UPI003514BC7E